MREVPIINVPRIGCWLFPPSVFVVLAPPNREPPVLVLPKVLFPNNPPGLAAAVLPNKLPPGRNKLRRGSVRFRKTT